MTAREKILRKCARATSGCWEWTGFKRPDGYGVYNGKRAHQAVYELLVGPIPKDKCLLHHCDNPPCCKPSHLFIGDRGDNIRDCIAKGRNNQHSPRPGNGYTKLSGEDVIGIRLLYEQGWLNTDIARAFGVTSSYISRIGRGFER